MHLIVCNFDENMLQMQYAPKPRLFQKILFCYMKKIFEHFFPVIKSGFIRNITNHFYN